MSIADKITSITNHLTNDYEGISNLGVDLTNIDKNIENIRTCLDTIYSNLPKVTGEDGTEVTLTPTLKGKLNIQEKGNSTQDGTPTPTNPISIKSVTGNNTVIVHGANICTSADVGSTTARIIFNFNRDLLQKTFTVSFKCNETLSNNTLRLYINDSEYSILGYFTGSANTTVSAIVTIDDTTLNAIKNATSYYLMLYKAGATFTTPTEAQIENGSSVSPYMSYVTPQTLPLNLGTIELNKIGDYQDYIYQTSGKNLFDRENATENTGLKWADGLTYTGASTTGMIISDYINITNIEKVTSNYVFCIFFYDSDKTYLGNGVQVKKESYSAVYRSITIPYSVAPNIYYARIEYRPQENYSEDMTTKNLMANTGDTALPYEPYGSGNWYKKEQIGKVVLTGSETTGTWKVANSGTANYMYQYQYVSQLPISNIGGTDKGLCSRYPFGNVGNTTTNQGIYMLTTGEIRIRWGTEDTINNYKTWLSTHNVTLMYQLATPNDIQITDTNLINQLENINKMKSYEDTTIITSTYDSNNAQMILGASSLKGE